MLAKNPKKLVKWCYNCVCKKFILCQCSWIIYQ